MITGVYQAKSGMNPSCHGFLELTFPQSQSKEDFYPPSSAVRLVLWKTSELHALFRSYYLAGYLEKAVVLLKSVRFTAVHKTSVRIADKAFEAIACRCGHRESH